MHVEHWEREPVEQLSEGIGRQMLHTKTMTVARIHLAEGAVVPSHAHPNEQVANVLSGSLRFVVGDEETIASAGQSVVIPADVPHQVECLADAIVLDVFSPPRADWQRGDDSYLRR